MDDVGVFCYSAAMQSPKPQGDLQLSIGYWIVSHKATLRTWWGITSLAIIAVTLLWMVIFFTIFFRQDRTVDALLINAANGAGQYSASAFQPQELIPGTVTVITRDETHVDMVADLKNSNVMWGAESVTAHFVVNGAALAAQRLVVNQQDHRPVVQLNVAVTSATGTVATLVIDDVRWARASAASLPAANFSVTDIRIVPSTVVVQGQTRTSVSVSANVTNMSVFNYYRVDVPILISSGDRIVGVGQVTIDRWATEVQKPIVLTLSYPVVQATTATILPYVSRFDTSNTYR